MICDFCVTFGIYTEHRKTEAEGEQKMVGMKRWMTAALAILTIFSFALLALCAVRLDAGSSSGRQTPQAPETRQVFGKEGSRGEPLKAALPPWEGPSHGAVKGAARDAGPMVSPA